MSKTVVKIGDIKKWGEGRKFSDKSLRLDEATVVTNRRLFFDSHIQRLYTGKDKINKRLLTPFYDRLVVFYRLVEEEQKRL